MDSFRALIGKRIKRVLYNPEDEVLGFETYDGETLTWTAVADCCAHAYFTHLDESGADALIGCEVVSAREDSMDARPEELAAESETLDASFYTIASRKGRMTVEFRCSHNGYYGGWAQPGGSLGENPKVLAEAA